VRLPLITYEWWRRMQLHHFTVALPPHSTTANATTAVDDATAEASTTTVLVSALAADLAYRREGTSAKATAAATAADATDTSTNAKQAKKAKSAKAKGAELTRFGWRVYGVPRSMGAMDLEHASQTAAFASLRAQELAATGTTIGAAGAAVTVAGHAAEPATLAAAVRTTAADAARLLAPWAALKPHKAVGKVDKAASLAFPGLKHHPYEKAVVGAFSLDDFLAANLKHRPVFVAGDFKSGDASGAAFLRLKRGLVDQLFLPGKNLQVHDLVDSAAALLPAVLPESLSRGALAIPGHTAEPWAFSVTPSSPAADPTPQRASALPLETGDWDYIVATK
jgi:hypothetical protein